MVMRVTSGKKDLKFNVAFEQLGGAGKSETFPSFVFCKGDGLNVSRKICHIPDCRTNSEPSE
jgi:hypothetical protein